MNASIIKKKFTELFVSEPLLVRSPGRINLIGEHTDYNEGFVFPAAIDKEIIFAVNQNSLNSFRFYSVDMDGRFEINLKDLKKSETPWANYLLGVAAQFKDAGYALSGVDCVFGGNIPIGAGVSSSAAIENGFAFALNEIFKLNIGKLDMVKMARKAEHEYAGVMCGIMDQFASMYGKSDHAIKLDCRSLDYEYVPIDLSEYLIILINTKVSHTLASSEYNTRRKECEAGVHILKKYDRTIEALRDVNLEMLLLHKNEFDPIIYKRCTYIVTENQRVEEAAEALRHNNIKKLGEIFFQAHCGMRDDYQISCKELDVLVEIAGTSEGVLGARMMGGGFGGCTINLVEKKHADAFVENAAEKYIEVTGIQPEVYIVTIANGTGLVNNEKL
jgi:galactokinase